MNIPQHVWARGYERHPPHEPLFGRYIRIDLSASPNLSMTFDAVSHMVECGQQASEVVPFSRVAWSLVFLGVEPTERERIAEVQQEYLQMWERHPDVWPKVQRREGVFSVWFVDRALRPFLGCVCEEAPWDVWVSGRDVREERIYQKFLAEGQPPIMMALNAVHASELNELWGARPAQQAA